MRISDWSSDVCSSDLPVDIRMGAVDPPRELVERIADVLIGFDVAARGRRDLEQINARVPVRMLVEEALVTEERSEEHTSELQSLMRTSYAVFCLKTIKKKQEYAG